MISAVMRKCTPNPSSPDSCSGQARYVDARIQQGVQRVAADKGEENSASEVQVQCCWLLDAGD